MGSTFSKKKDDSSSSSGASSSSSQQQQQRHASSSSAGSNGEGQLDIKEQLVLDEPAPVYGGDSSAHDYNPSEPAGSAIASVDTQEAAIGFWSREKTFRPQRAIPENAGGGKGARILRTVNATMKATLGGGDLQLAVRCPAGEDRNEWLAVNTVQFFNAASLIFGTVQSYCTHASCPVMAAGKAQYLWKDNTPKYKKPTSLAAPVYIDLMMSEIDAQITDPSIFPIDEDGRFPRNFMTVVKLIYKRLFRLYAHIYCAHHDNIRAIGASAHLNTTFKHLIFFIMEFGLVDKVELQPLEKLINRFINDSGVSSSSSASSGSPAKR